MSDPLPVSMMMELIVNYLRGHTADAWEIHVEPYEGTLLKFVAATPGGYQWMILLSQEATAPEIDQALRFGVSVYWKIMVNNVENL